MEIIIMARAVNTVRVEKLLSLNKICWYLDACYLENFDVIEVTDSTPKIFRYIN